MSMNSSLLSPSLRSLSWGLAMGFNTTVVVMNDALGYIESDPDFGKNLARAIARAWGGGPVDVPAYGPHGRGVHCNAAVVVETHHADHDVLVRVGGNRGEVVK
jgi:hypothetical protein